MLSLACFPANDRHQRPGDELRAAHPPLFGGSVSLFHQSTLQGDVNLLLIRRRRRGRFEAQAQIQTDLLPRMHPLRPYFPWPLLLMFVFC